MRVQTVAGLRGFSMPDAVGKNDVVARRIEELARPEQFTRKNRREELMARAACSVQDQDGVGGTPMRVACGLSQRRVMKPQLRQRFARAKLEVLRDIVALRRRGYR